MPEAAAFHSPMLWHRIGRQLAHPHGWPGHLIGTLMGLANREPNRLVLEKLAAEANDTVLDLGCGPGHAIAMLAPHCAHVHGIDQSAVMVRQASRRNRRAVRCGRVSIAPGSFHDLPYPDGHFDRIMASNVMYFWNDIPAVIAELRRVLRPAGRIVIYVTDASSMRSWRFAQTGTHRLFSVGQFGDHLRRATAGGMSTNIEVVRMSGGVRGLFAVLDDLRRHG